MSRVLVVDDNPLHVRVVDAYLEHAVDEVRSLTDSREVEEVFAAFQPDLVVLDLHMPPPDGLEVLRRLRGARTSLGYLPVIVLTADGTRVARNSALILGADEVVIKSVDREGLVLRVRNLLQTRRAYVSAREGRSD